MASSVDVPTAASVAADIGNSDNSSTTSGSNQSTSSSDDDLKEASSCLNKGLEGAFVFGDGHKVDTTMLSLTKCFNKEGAPHPVGRSSCYYFSYRPTTLTTFSHHIVLSLLCLFFLSYFLP